MRILKLFKFGQFLVITFAFLFLFINESQAKTTFVDKSDFESTKALEKCYRDQMYSSEALPSLSYFDSFKEWDIATNKSKLKISRDYRACIEDVEKKFGITVKIR